uniref:hypothetical protein n=1 Tax=Candidatus Entotheonella palauensis TaxID=93172 RepID=UPI0011782127
MSEFLTTQSKHIDIEVQFIPPLDSRQGNAFRKMRSISQDPKASRKFLEDLENDKLEYISVLLKHGVIEEAEIRHFQQHWFPPDWQDNPDKDPEVMRENLRKYPHIYWQGLQPIVGIIRRGTTRAFKLSVAAGPDNPKVIEGWWYVLEGFNHVVVSVQESKNQIT